MKRNKHSIKILGLLTFFVILFNGFLLLSFPSVFADVGDLLKTVDAPASAQCNSGIGTSVAIVPGRMIGLDQYPILIVTSCFVYDPSDSQKSNLYFLDPSTSPATLVRTITTNPTPANGWGSLSLRGDKGDLLGCGNDPSTAPIYRIDISPYTSTPDGTAVFLFNGTAQYNICDGVAWDTGDNTIFQSPDVYDTIFHYSDTGALIGSFPAPAGCRNSGLAVGGASLFAACNGVLTIHQMNKTNGSVFTTFPTAGTRTEDIECDPESFASSGVDAMWSKDAYTDQLFAFEIPSGTCGFAGGPPVVPAACPDGSTTDTDGDALLDCWETNGIDWDGDGTIDLQLYDVNGDGTIQASEDADLNHKDIYVEVDWMDQHQPNNASLNDVTNSFANAPVSNPDGTRGIRLHIQTNEQAVAHNNSLAFEPCTSAAGVGVPDFDAVKLIRFGTAAERSNANNINILNAKRFAFHYVLFVHNLTGLGGTSGCAELPGNDFVVSLGSWTQVNGHGVGNRDEQAGTFMHEFGHNLNLRHGGGDNINFKPNYLSVMSYTRQIAKWYVFGRPLNYSISLLPTLNESNLSEPLGIGGSPGDFTAFGPPPEQTNVNASNGIDWNRDGDTTDVGVAANVNNFGDGGFGSVLTGYDDWANLKYNFRASVDFADGIHLTVLEADEVNIDEAELISPDTDGDNVVNVRDNCPIILNPNQTDSDTDGYGDVCDNCPNVTNPDQADSDGDGIGDACETIPGDIDGDGDVDRNDLNILLSYRNKPASAYPACDLNSDGKITALDSRKLVLLCTRPRCATQ